MSDEERVERQLRAFGASLQHEAGESLQPGGSQSQSAGVEGSADRQRRRWIAFTGAAACVALATVGGLWLVNGTERSVAPADTPIAEPPATSSQPAPTSSSTEVTSVVTSPPTETLPPIKTTLPATQILGTVLDSSPLTARLEGCPALGFTDLPNGWGERLEQLPTEEPGVARFQLAAPSGQVLIEMGPLTNSGGQFAPIDGYPATTRILDDDVLMQISVNRGSRCQTIRLRFVGLEDTEVSKATMSIDIDDSALTDVDAAIRIGGEPNFNRTLFDRGPFSRVDAEPFIATTSRVFGAPDSDTGWIPMPSDLSCTGASEYRSIFWGDLRVVFERSDGNDILGAWSVGDQQVSLIAPNDPYRPTRSLGLSAQEGLAVGADISVLDQFPLLGSLGDGRYQIGGAVIVRVQADGNTITGFGVGRNDCF